MKSQSRSLAALAAVALAGAAVSAATPAAEAATYSCRGETATIVGTAGADTLRGTSGRDIIVGLAGNDAISGGGGDDLICGGDGDDRIRGGDGNDRAVGGTGSDDLRGDAGDDVVEGGADRVWQDSGEDGYIISRGDVLRGGAGSDTIHPGPPTASVDIDEPDLIVYDDSPRGVSVDLSTGPATGRAQATGRGTDTIFWRANIGVVGSHHADGLTGSSDDDYLVGGLGDDTLSAGGGEWNVLYPDRAEQGVGRTDGTGGGDDVIHGGDGADEVVSFAGTDEIHGGNEWDLISLRGGHGHQVYGDAGHDFIWVRLTPAADLLEGARFDGGADPDSVQLAVVGRADGRRYVVDATGAAYTAIEKFGLDAAGATWEFRGSEAAETVGVVNGRLVAHGNGGNDVISGGSAADRLFGEAGNDRLFGEEGNDLLDGGEDTDRLDGSLGTDSCVNGETVVNCET